MGRVRYSLRATVGTHANKGFTLIELLFVMGIITVLLALMMPALGPASARAVDGSARQLLSDLESARLMAINRRTRSRVLIPVSQQPGFTPDAAYLTYAVVLFNRTTNLWAPPDRISHLLKPVAFHPNFTPDVATEENPIQTRAAEVTPIDANGDGTQDFVFTGPYIEFLANGSSSLDATAPTEVVALVDAAITRGATPVVKNKNWTAELLIDPLSGGVRLK